jgi:pimeloyl-ACP methyl ester carboxylesterase
VNGAAVTPPLRAVQVPETDFVSIGRDRVAYLVFGNGPANALFLTPAWVSVDAQWENVGVLRIWRLAAERFRVVILDHRGFGMSDPLDESLVGDPTICVEDEPRCSMSSRWIGSA